MNDLDNVMQILKADPGKVQQDILCPIHGDSRESLSIKKTHSKILLHCHAGCDAKDILAIYDLKLSDLTNSTPIPPSKTRTVDYSKPAEFYDYKDEEGKIVRRVLRFDSKDGKSKSFRQQKPCGSGFVDNVKGVRSIPYRLNEIVKSTERVIIVEGEKDADNLADLGFAATCNSGGAGKWKPEHAAYMKDREVVVVEDNDEPGRRHAKIVCESLLGIAKSVRLISFRENKNKFDVSDWILEGNSKRDVEKLIETAPLFQPTRRFSGIDVSELNSLINKPVEWLVEDIFSSDQTTLIGAPSKCCKTTFLADLAISFAAKCKWLNHFIVPAQRRVLFITGEATGRAIACRLDKAANSKELCLSDLKDWLFVETSDFPHLASKEELNNLARAVALRNVGVVIIDPLYCGLSNIDTNKLAEMGKAITDLAKACRPASLIISHHTTKTTSKTKNKYPTLEDMNGAGIAESVGNWFLIKRKKEYNFSGKHVFNVQYGGRDEQSGCNCISFDELDWTFNIKSTAETIQLDTAAQISHRADQCETDKKTISSWLKQRSRPVSKTQLRDNCGVSRNRYDSVLDVLIKEQIVVLRGFSKGSRWMNNGLIHRDNAAEYDEYQKLAHDPNGSTGTRGNHPETSR